MLMSVMQMMKKPQSNTIKIPYFKRKS